MRNFNETFWKGVTFKKVKETGILPVSRKYIFGKSFFRIKLVSLKLEVLFKDILKKRFPNHNMIQLKKATTIIISNIKSDL